MPEAARSAAASIQVGRDPNDLDLRPAKQHGNRARIIGIPAEIGVDVYAHA